MPIGLKKRRTVAAASATRHREGGPGDSWAPLSAFPEARRRLVGEITAGLISDIAVRRLHQRLAFADAKEVATVAAQIQAASDLAALVEPIRNRRGLIERRSTHALDAGHVRIGQIVDGPRNDRGIRRKSFAVGPEVLTTSMLVVGPPGSGKTRSFAMPILEHLCLQSLAEAASVVVLDPKATEFADEGHFDVTIDPTNPTHGFNLYGGASCPEEAADRLAAALLPQMSGDHAYFADASRNALYTALTCFHAAHHRYPKLSELVEVLAGTQSAWDSINSRLKNQDVHAQYSGLIAARRSQQSRREDPAVSLIERINILNRPQLVHLFDDAAPTFSMRDINQPTRVRIVIPESRFPDASLILARLAISQFVQTVTAPDTNRQIFKGLICDEAGRYVDDYVARGTQTMRSSNAGMVMLTQSLGDIPPELTRTIFASVGCKAIFGGVDPETAQLFSDTWGTEWIRDTTYSAGRAAAAAISVSQTDPEQDRQSQSQTSNSSMSTRRVERARWSVSDIITQVPTGHAVVSLATPDGRRTGPTLVNTRHQLP